MIKTEPVQVKYTNRLKSAQCCLCYYHNLLNQLTQVSIRRFRAIERLLILSGRYGLLM